MHISRRTKRIIEIVDEDILPSSDGFTSSFDSKREELFANLEQFLIAQRRKESRKILIFMLGILAVAADLSAVVDKINWLYQLLSQIIERLFS